MSKLTIRNSYRTITNPRLDQDAAGWFVAYSYRNDGQGRTYSGRERLGAMSRDEARVALEAWQKTQAQMSAVSAVKILDEILTPYETDVRARAHPPKTFLLNVGVLRRALGHTPIGLINSKLLNDFAAARGIKPQSLRSYVGTLNTAFNFAGFEGKITLAETRRFKLPKAAGARLHFLPLEEQEEVYARAMGESIGKPRLADITIFVALGLDTGSRCGAIQELTYDRIHLKANAIDFVNPHYQPKNKNRVKIKIPRRLRPLLERVMRERRPGQETVLTPGYDASAAFSRWIRSVPEWRGTNIGKTTAHSMRHTFATHLLVERGFKLATVASLMGDTLKTVTEHYGHLEPSDTDFDL